MLADGARDERHGITGQAVGASQGEALHRPDQAQGASRHQIIAVGTAAAAAAAQVASGDALHKCHVVDHQGLAPVQLGQGFTAIRQGAQ